MQKYKFRAQDYDGHTYYGDLIHAGDMVFIRQNHDKPTVRVKPETIRLLVGYVPGSNLGVREVYDGDVLYNEVGNEACAEIFVRTKDEIGDYEDFDFGDIFSGFKFRELD